MKFSDIVSSLEIAFVTEIALVLFLALFITIVVRLFRKSNRSLHIALAEFPLHDLPAANPAPTERSQPHARTQ